MAVETWGVDVEDLAMTLRSAKGLDEDVAEQAIEEMAGEIGGVLLIMRIDPAAVTEADFPTDRVVLQRLLRAGAAANYVYKATGSTKGAEAHSTFYREKLADLSRNPNQLVIYARRTGVNMVTTHSTAGNQSSSLTAAYRADLDGFINPNRWLM